MRIRRAPTLFNRTSQTHSSQIHTNKSHFQSHLFCSSLQPAITLNLIPMKPSRKTSFCSSYSATFTCSYRNDHTNPDQQLNSGTHVPVHLPRQSQFNAAVKIQSTYRAHRVRTLYRKIAAVDSEADQLQRLIQQQDTVNAIRSSELEKLRMNEALMGLLLRLDSVPGIDPTVREARRKVSRRIVGLQEILDSVSEAKVEEHNWWDYDGLMKKWDEDIAALEENICRERGGEEMDRFCVQNLGFRCLQRFLREP